MESFVYAVVDISEDDCVLSVHLTEEGAKAEMERLFSDCAPHAIDWNKWNIVIRKWVLKP